MGAFMAEAPRTRVYEANICLSYYRQNDPTAIGPDGTVSEKLCKIDPVQQRMATIFGWQEMFAASLVGLQLNGAWVLIICEYGPRHNPIMLMYARLL
jgi:hypothetical protein